MEQRSSWQALAFGAGLIVLFIALISPLDALGGVLFSAQMLQHTLRMLVAAPLLVIGAPLLPWLGLCLVRGASAWVGGGTARVIPFHHHAP